MLCVLHSFRRWRVLAYGVILSSGRRDKLRSNDELNGLVIVFGDERIWVEHRPIPNAKGKNECCH